MIHILEYIMQHYALFLGGAILILLAIIGYYADKTNFGQGKNLDITDNNNIKDLNKLRLLDVTGNNGSALNITSQSQQENQELVQASDSSVIPNKNDLEIKTENTSNLVSNEKLGLDNNVENNLDNLNNDNSNVDIIKEDLGTQINSSDNRVVIESAGTIKQPENSNNDVLNKEQFDKFDDEFNSILPQKDLITNDLLGEIDDLKLDKTQKLDFSSIPNLNDIELPKIKSRNVDNENIWKF